MKTKLIWKSTKFSFEKSSRRVNRNNFFLKATKFVTTRKGFKYEKNKNRNFTFLLFLLQVLKKIFQDTSNYFR